MVTSRHDASDLLREVLRADHRHVETLLEQLLDALDANDCLVARAVWTGLQRALLAHMAEEEATMIPRIERPFPVAAAALLREHRRIRQRLAALGGAIELRAVAPDAARPFMAELRAHGQNEEQVLYRWADEILDAGEKAEVVEGWLRRLGMGSNETTVEHDAAPTAP